MENTLSVLFYLKKTKTDRNGKTPIYLRITVDGKRSELSANRKIDLSQWNASTGMANPFGEENMALNNYLVGLKSKVYKQFNILQSLDQDISPVAIKNVLSGTSERKHTLIEVFQYHNDQFKQSVGIDYSEGTYKHYRCSIDKVKSFLKYQYRKTDMLLEEVDHQFITKYEMYLKAHDKCSHNTTIKQISRLKKVIKLAIANDWLMRDPFLNYKCTYKETRRGYLNLEELTNLEQKEISLKRIEIVRDIFVFCCYTGLSYADVEKLTANDITTGIDGEKWIIIYRKKTDTRSPIPILPQAQSIINKYKGDIVASEKGKILPVHTNQRLNSYLKEIADICGITKNLSMHLARHTFATTVTLANGVPIETVSKMLGHTDIKTTQIYSKVVDSKISQDMQMLKNKMQKIGIRKAI